MYSFREDALLSKPKIILHNEFSCTTFCFVHNDFVPPTKPLVGGWRFRGGFFIIIVHVYHYSLNMYCWEPPSPTALLLSI